MKNNYDEHLLELLAVEWHLLEISVVTLLHSLNKCMDIGTKREYSFEEQESFDSLTSKFSRTSDLFTQKIVRTVWTLLHEPFVPFIDLLNKAEKMNLIYSSDQIIAIRDLRNQIAHEYLPEAIYNLVPEVIDLIRQLVENIDCCKRFLDGRNWIKQERISTKKTR
jgi:hypothetical protein